MPTARVGVYEPQGTCVTNSLAGEHTSISDAPRFWFLGGRYFNAAALLLARRGSRRGMQIKDCGHKTPMLKRRLVSEEQNRGLASYVRILWAA